MSFCQLLENVADNVSDTFILYMRTQTAESHLIYLQYIVLRLGPISIFFV